MSTCNDIGGIYRNCDGVHPSTNDEMEEEGGKKV